MLCLSLLTNLLTGTASIVIGIIELMMIVVMLVNYYQKFEKIEKA